MSDAEEEVKAHPCDQYNIPDCPGKFWLKFFGIGVIYIQWLLQIRAFIALFVLKRTTITPNKGIFCMPYLTFFLENFGWSYLY